MNAESEPGKPLRHAEPVMGTVVSFAVYPGELEPGAVTAALAGACGRLHEADATFSTYLPESPINRLRSGAADLGELPPDVAEVLDLCEEVRAATAGWFDPWAMPGGVDPTGLVKGWAAERAIGELVRAGVDAAMVNAAGDLVVYGRPGPAASWRIGIAHPWRVGALACVIEADAAVATSGTYERGAHLLDPRTGRPGAAVASATVTGPSLAIADALATALALAGSDAIELVTGYGGGYEAYVIGANGAELASDGIRFAPAVVLGRDSP